MFIIDQLHPTKKFISWIRHRLYLMLLPIPLINTVYTSGVNRYRRGGHCTPMDVILGKIVDEKIFLGETLNFLFLISGTINYLKLKAILILIV